MGNGYGVEVLHQVFGLAEKDFQSGVLDSVLAVHLFDQQLAVAVDDEAPRRKFRGPAEGADQRGVFGHVVRGFAEAIRFFDVRLTIASDDVGEGRRAGVTTSRPIDVDSK